MSGQQNRQSQGIAMDPTSSIASSTPGPPATMPGGQVWQTPPLSTSGNVQPPALSAMSGLGLAPMQRPQPGGGYQPPPTWFPQGPTTAVPSQSHGYGNDMVTPGMAVGRNK